MSASFGFCDECLPTSMKWCENMHFITGLQHATSYHVKITNHFDQVYLQNVTSDSDGNITIDISKFPEQFFNPYSGIYILTVYNLQDQLQDIINGYQSYSCISFDIYNEQDAN